ncbi:MAG: carbonic anhydrase family protein [Anaerolineales bacterium]
MKSSQTIILVLTMVFLAACSSLPALNAPFAEPTAAPAKIHWTYEGEEGPEHWGELDSAYSTCSNGTRQSPIDLSNATKADLANIVFNYQPSEISILNNGHTVQVSYTAGGYIEVDGARYEVAQFHYHSPSEHTLNGESFPAEIHIVHKNSAGKLALVIGILLTEGAENPAYQAFLDNLPSQPGPETKLNFPLTAADLLPAVQTTLRYSGSLTTPPCTEEIAWFVMTTPVELSSAQLQHLESVYNGNNRPVQPLNQRPLTEDSTP